MSELNSGQIQKIVLSRIKEVKTEKNALEIFKELNTLYKGTFNYILSNREIGTWIGASPELLLRSEGKQVTTVSLAGTKPTNEFSEWTEKEQIEQKYVTDFIVDTFKKNKCEEIKISEPITFTAGPVQHLKTEITAVVENSKLIWNILNDLHPTPATCGIPKELAKSKIIETETHDRKFYTGYIGILNENLKTFFVNLRCLELQKGRALLYVGGGITSQSTNENEWIETERKAVTLLKVLN